MLTMLKNESNTAYTENGAKINRSAMSECLDLFFAAGAMRNSDKDRIVEAVVKAYCEDPEKTMKIIFFARDVRGGLGERRFFRAAMETLAEFAPEAVRRNIPFIADYGRYDDLCVLLNTPCAEYAAAEISRVLNADLKAMSESESVSLIAKWLPSVNASSRQTVALAKKLCKMLHMTEKDYRRTLSSLRAYIGILENDLRKKDYTFDYSKQPSGAMLKYRMAFIRNDRLRYTSYLSRVIKGEDKMHASTLYPYDIVRKVLDNYGVSAEERVALDASWRSLDSHGDGAENSRAIAVVDGSGSMYGGRSVRPIDAALSLGVYFAEHNKGAFANHFITFSRTPQLVEVKGRDIYEKVNYCSAYNEVANTNLCAVFDLILVTALKNRLPQDEMPERLYIISDMEFDCAVSNFDETIFRAQKAAYEKHGYKLPRIIFWNVDSRHENCPVTFSETGAALVSGFSPALFDMVKAGDISPEIIMNDIIMSERYAKVS
ncbi:MAG: DUF2828 family protein [Oscillospiraceae bacterium]|nr:DUF2828 family protein [Oscillospiraceae bacterium]